VVSGQAILLRVAGGAIDKVEVADLTSGQLIRTGVERQQPGEAPRPESP
jgi:hypothetical protein